MATNHAEQHAADCRHQVDQIQSACDVISCVLDEIIAAVKEGDADAVEIDATPHTRTAFQQARKALKQQKQSWRHVAMCLENSAADGKPK